MGRHLEVDQGQALLRVSEDIVEVRVTVDEDCPVVGKEPYPLRQPGVGSVKKRVRQPVSTPQTRQDHIEQFGARAIRVRRLARLRHGIGQPGVDQRVWKPDAGPDTTVFLEVLPQVEPDEAPDPVNICDAARGVFEAELRKRRVHPRDARVEFKVHPSFDPRLKYLYPWETARFRSNQFWECRFQYPDPDLRI